MPFIASIILLALIASTVLLALNVAAGGGSVILALRLQSRLDISVASSSLSSLCADGSDTVLAMRLPVKGFSGWSRPMLQDHADLAATGFDQDDAAGLAAEPAFDNHLLEKRMLLDAAACAPTSTRPVLFACECCCVESALDCLCGSGACTSCVAVLH